MKDAFWITLSIVQLVALAGLLMWLPVLYHREAEKEANK